MALAGKAQVQHKHKRKSMFKLREQHHEKPPGSKPSSQYSNSFTRVWNVLKTTVFLTKKRPNPKSILGAGLFEQTGPLWGGYLVRQRIWRKFAERFRYFA